MLAIAITIITGTLFAKFTRPSPRKLLGTIIQEENKTIKEHRMKFTNTYVGFFILDMISSLIFFFTSSIMLNFMIGMFIYQIVIMDEIKKSADVFRWLEEVSGNENATIKIKYENLENKNNGESP